MIRSAKALILLLLTISFILAQPDPYNLHILYTQNNNGVLLNCHCPTEPWGGLEKRMTLLKTWRDRNQPYILVDTGDFLSFRGDPDKDLQVIRSMELMGYDAVNLGDQEFSNGKEFLAEHVLKADLPLISTNLDVGIPGSIDAVRVIEYQGLSIGIAGVLHLEYIRYYSDTEDVGGVSPSLAVQSLYAENDAFQGADIQVLLSNLGLDADKKISGELPFIDVIIGGHSQHLLAQPIYHDGALIVQCGKDGQFVGHLSLEVRDKKVKRYRHEFLKVTENLKDDPEVMAIIEE